MKFKSLTWNTVVAFTLAAAPMALADRININLTSMVPTGTGSDGVGALGGGTWNRINDEQAALANALVKSTGDATAVTVIDTGTGNPGGASQTGNAIQHESWGRNDPVSLTISGLLPNQVYKVVVYGDRVGTGAPGTDSYNVNGVEKTLPNLGEADIPLPGVENADYGIFIVDATAGGQITVTAPYVAGVQIEGLISTTEPGPQIDCRISKSGAVSGGKGDGVYNVKPDRRQSITQQTRGARGKRYYVNIENDGDEVDNCYGMGFWSRRKAKVKVIDRGGNGNVTAAVQGKDYRYELSKGETRRFKVVVKPASRKRATINVQLCGSPSTLVRKRQDCATCVLKVK